MYEKIPTTMMFRSIWIGAVLVFLAGAAQAKIPDGWSFIDFNAAVRVAKRTGKPLFIYFGFADCPYCDYVNKHTFASEKLRKRYADHYVLAYFNIHGAPDDVITLPGGEELTRADALKRFKGSPVPAWTFMTPEGKEILMRRGSRTGVDAFVKFDLYVASESYRKTSFSEFLAQRGLHEDPVE